MSIIVKTICVGPSATNTYVVHATKGRQAIIIDPGAEPKLIAQEIKGLNVTHILLTHGHSDHFMASRMLRAITQAKLCIHAGDAHMLKEYLEIDPDIRFVRSFSVKMGRSLLEMIYTPGHSAGSVCYYDQASQILFSGDTILSDGPGCTFFPSGSVSRMERSLAELKGLPEEVRVFPGHGPSFLLKVIQDFQAI